jgi:hypothetical protein
MVFIYAIHHIIILYSHTEFTGINLLKPSSNFTYDQV